MVKTERKKYLTTIVNQLLKKIDKEQLIHLAHFAYNHKNHKALIELQVIQLFQDFLMNPDQKIKELSLGGLCNFASNPESHKFLQQVLIISQWDQVSVHGQRSIACILYYCSYKNSDLKSIDKVTTNILACLE